MMSWECDELRLNVLKDKRQRNEEINIESLYSSQPIIQTRIQTKWTFMSEATAEMQGKKTLVTDYDFC